VTRLLWFQAAVHGCGHQSVSKLLKRGFELLAKLSEGARKFGLAAQLNDFRNEVVGQGRKYFAFPPQIVAAAHA